MTLVDTSIWVDHFRATARAAPLVALLSAGEVLVHPWVIGELALGQLGRRRAKILADLRLLPPAPVVAGDDVHRLIDAHGLAGTGVGWVDAQLLAAALLVRAALWTGDGRLARAGVRLGVPLV